QGGRMTYESFVAYQEKQSHEYSDNPLNVGNLKAGVISSPYQDIAHHPGHSDKQRKLMSEKALWGEGTEYSKNPHQVGNLRVAVTSPPYRNRFDAGNEKQKHREGTLQNEMGL